MEMRIAPQDLSIEKNDHPRRAPASAVFHFYSDRIQTVFDSHDGTREVVQVAAPVQSA
jgi:hypothetical protein